MCGCGPATLFFGDKPRVLCFPCAFQNAVFLRVSIIKALFLGAFWFHPFVEQTHAYCNVQQCCWWLCGAINQWFRPDWSSRALPKWWWVRFECRSFHSGPRSTRDGFGAISTEEGHNSCSPLSCSAADPSPDIARARRWGEDCNTVLHFHPR